jgi:hypothetical protein
MRDPDMWPRRVLGPLALLCWFSFGGLYVWYDFNRPHVPDASVGRVYSINNHGSIAYLTLREAVVLYGLAGVSAALLLVGVGIEAATRRRRNAEVRKSYEGKAET